MGMAYDFADPVKTPYDLKKWLQYKAGAEPHCVICNDLLLLRNLHNGRTAHFLHRGGSGCPTVENASNAYAYLTKLARSSGASAHVRSFVSQNLYGVFNRMRKLADGLTWFEFKQCCQNAAKLKVWDLVDLPVDLAPYVLLTCMGEFPATGFRSQAIFFFLEPNPTGGKFWMFPKERKRIIYKIAGSKKDLTPHDIDYRPAQGPVIAEILALL